jgi:D-lactate dehydrogenase (cytochrome)
MDEPRGAEAMNERHASIEPAVPALSELLGDRFVTSRAVREQHGRDESPLPAAAPDAVAFPRNSEEVSRILQICSEHRVPVIPFGAGTSLEGHVLATAGGISLDMTTMNSIVEVNVNDLDVRVEAGVTRRALNDRLARDGLFFPVDPGADATLGGMAATGASGTTTVLYGAMRENVLALQVVLADGRVIETAKRARKSVAGYDTTRLFIGSEGTLGVITELTLRLYGIPEVVSSAVCSFPDVENAVGAVIAILQQDIPVARIEFVDEVSMRAINAYSGTSLAEAPSLFLEFRGSPGRVAEEDRDVATVVVDSGATDYRSSIESGERKQLWRARHDHFYASVAMRPGARAITTDVCVPISALAESILEARDDIASLGLMATVVGHVGDGNFHVVILVDPDDHDEMAAAEEMNTRMVGRAVAAGGTCTGEHGIGVRKRELLVQELPGAVEVMRSLKQTLDPRDILNPGKIFLTRD